MTWRCPTCRAPYRGGTNCHRCRSDLSQLLTILEQAAQQKSHAVHLWREGRLQEAQEAIQQSLFLHRDPESEKIAALIQASLGDYAGVLSLLKKRS